MGWIWPAAMGLIGVAVGAVGARRRVPRRRAKSGLFIRDLLQVHFHPQELDDLAIFERSFPFRVRVDLQKAIDLLFAADTEIHRFCGIEKENHYEELGFAQVITEGHSPAVSVPAQHEEVDIGEERPVRCLKNGLWLLERDKTRFAVLLTPAERFRQVTGILFQIAAPKSVDGEAIAEAFFKHLEESILKSESYRGKVLSLEIDAYSYSGASRGIKVHKLRSVAREQVILPTSTLELLERNVLRFVRQREQLSKRKLSTKKGILFYGPPGTGKTHTIHYLAGALEGHTTLLISGEQVAVLAEYMTLARLLQPSIVVLEDADLIARDRADMGSPCEEVLLNKLLNEMDGLKEDADILFILTTNRPEALETALTSRPGRIDQAIEFPFPDEAGREKLVHLYSQGAPLADGVVQAIVRRTEKVSAAFIKELMRRSAQFSLERDGSERIELMDVENALEEMLFRGGSLNMKLLGAEGPDKCA